MSRRKAFTLVELLVVIAIIAVLLAILLPSLRNAKSLAQRISCKHRLASIGKGLSFYADQYDGLIPPPASDPTTGLPSIRTPYEVYQDPDTNAATANNIWLNLGCLVKAQLITSGKDLYCPANLDALKEYESYQLAPDGVTRVQWGTIPNFPTYTSTWWRVETKKGYAFWPQSRQLIKDAAQLAQVANAGPRYAIGYPQTPAKYADLNSNKALSCDYSAHTVQGSGYNIQVVFSDTHVNMQKIPVDPVTGKYWYPYQSSPPSDYNPTQWITVTTDGGINTSIFMYTLQP